jgi:hypothetical protein
MTKLMSALVALFLIVACQSLNPPLFAAAVGDFYLIAEGAPQLKLTQGGVFTVEDPAIYNIEGTGQNTTVDMFLTGALTITRRDGSPPHSLCSAPCNLAYGAYRLEVKGVGGSLLHAFDFTLESPAIEPPPDPDPDPEPSNGYGPRGEVLHAPTADVTINVPEGGSIGLALSQALTHRTAGRSVLINLAPGTYRQKIANTNSGIGPRIYLFGPDAIVSGSEVRTGWTSVSSTQWSLVWTNNWGATGGAIDRQADPNVSRRECLFQNGQRVRQVYGRTAMRDGTFFVDEAADRIFVDPFGSSLGTMEVCILDYVWNVDIGDFTAIGIQWQHCASPWKAACVNTASNQEYLYNDFVDSGQKGVQMGGSNTRILDSTFMRNGFAGWGSGDMTGYEICWFDNGYNNWRGGEMELANGAPNPWKDWDTGNKFLHSEDTTFCNGRIHHNASTGIWPDTDHDNLTLRGLLIEENDKHGGHIELCQGPINVIDVIARNNGQDPAEDGDDWRLAVCDNINFTRVTTDGEIQFNDSDTRSLQVTNDDGQTFTYWPKTVTNTFIDSPSATRQFCYYNSTEQAEVGQRTSFINSPAQVIWGGPGC